MASQVMFHNATDLPNYLNSDNGNSKNFTLGLDNRTIIKFLKAQNLVSRSVYIYSIFGLLGLVMGILILIRNIRNYKQNMNFEKLDIILLSLTVADFTLILFSLTDVVRPEEVNTTALGCAILSFFFNISYFYTGYTHIVIFFLVYDHLEVARRALKKVYISILAVMGISITFSILITSISGAGQHPNMSVNCHVDPLEAPDEYSILKFVFGFLIPTLIILGLLLHFLVHSKCLQKAHEHQDHIGCFHPQRVFLMLVTVTFICRLIYNILLLHKSQEDASHHISGFKLMPLVTIRELVMFAGSCLCLMFIAIFHELRHQAMINAYRNHNVMSPNIEITGNHEESASLN
ncbi:uncharacterized protein LOC125462290 [Stegostoma tigrinum]|uniref:uncharacterized protein LOC125462290 n=1 Tax=Stegostoma tigrinum TaxID=3053191 RepID=UPI00202B52FE|nr:uncharacterized protein LOC125462290 [Stegostoma tigrinum]XP_048408114.1 uncharacterized protein LOC125462290 [Stegostoma tigrinum]